MWERAELKQRAKNILRNNYWMAFAVCLVAGVITGGISGVSSRFNNGSTGNFANFKNGDINLEALTAIIIAAFFIASIVIAISVVFSFFVTNPISVGKAKYFLNSREGRGNIADLFFAFNGSRYIGIVGAMAWRVLFTWLWSLLFIIPGIVKAFAYSMTPYILAENPNIGYQRALKLSIAMTDGNKGEIFVMGLSFIGWYLLGLVACCVGVLFVNPYFETTMAELYIELRNSAIYRGLCSPQELNLIPIDPMGQNTVNP